MKVIKDRSNGALAKLTDKHAKKVIDAKDMILLNNNDRHVERFCYSTKSALKSRLNSNKKQSSINIRLYFRERIELKIKFRRQTA